MSRSTLQQLHSTELFADCRRSQLAKLDELGCVVRIKAGRTLCTEGTPGAEFFVLLDGDVEVRTNAGTIATLHRGAWFGEVALLDRGARRATVTAPADATVLVFDRREFATLLKIAPEARARVHRSTRNVLAGAPPTMQPWYQPARIGVAGPATATGGVSDRCSANPRWATSGTC
jgi:CRP-like cAMP-binding protein